MSLQLQSPNGHAVFIRRPDLVISVHGYEKADKRTGEMRVNSVITFQNREIVFVAGCPEAINAALDVQMQFPNEDIRRLDPTGDNSLPSDGGHDAFPADQVVGDGYARMVEGSI